MAGLSSCAAFVLVNSIYCSMGYVANPNCLSLARQ